MCNHPIVSVKNQPSYHQHSTPLLPLSVRVRLEDEISAAWREFAEGTTVFPTPETLHEEFWQWMTKTRSSSLST